MKQFGSKLDKQEKADEPGWKREGDLTQGSLLYWVSTQYLNRHPSSIVVFTFSLFEGPDAI